MKIVKEIGQKIPPEAGTDISDIQKVNLGVLWILQAIASEAVQMGQLTAADLYDGLKIQAVLQSYQPRLEEVLPELIAATVLSLQETGYIRHRAGKRKRRVYRTKKEPVQGYNVFVESFLVANFTNMVQEVIKAQEEFKRVEMIMVVGHQGVGKSLAIDFFTQRGFTPLSMSQIVREVVNAWGLNDTGTIDKIVAGQVFKNYFGQDVLVRLGIEYLINQGKHKIVIDGPKVLEEATSFLSRGGKLIGIVADTDSQLDQQIRRSRVAYRAGVDPNRAADLPNFDNREKIESSRINAILALVKPEDMFVNIQPESLHTALSRAFPETPKV